MSWCISSQAPALLKQENSKVHVLSGLPEFSQWVKLQWPRALAG